MRFRQWGAVNIVAHSKADLHLVAVGARSIWGAKGRDDLPNVVDVVIRQVWRVVRNCRAAELDVFGGRIPSIEIQDIKEVRSAREELCHLVPFRCWCADGRI